MNMLQCSPVKKKYIPYLPKELNDASYEEFVKISRVIHLSDYEECLQSQSLKSHPISAFDHCSCWSNYGLKILWFATSSRNPDDHSFYGNISFEVAIKDVINYFGKDFRMYYIEYIEYATSIGCRILITRKSLEKLVQMGTNILECYDITAMDKVNMPVYFYDTFMVAVNNVNYQIKHGYKVDFLIDCEENDLGWFYQNCRKVAVNHSEANTFKERTRQYRPCICRKHNNRNTIWKEVCPTAFTKKETEEFISHID